MTSRQIRHEGNESDLLLARSLGLLTLLEGDTASGRVSILSISTETL
jgi:hypothetical protein